MRGRQRKTTTKSKPTCTLCCTPPLAVSTQGLGCFGQFVAFQTLGISDPKISILKKKMSLGNFLILALSQYIENNSYCKFVL